jgi:hypothetical protein
LPGALQLVHVVSLLCLDASSSGFMRSQGLQPIQASNTSLSPERHKANVANQ